MSFRNGYCCNSTLDQIEVAISPLFANDYWQVGHLSLDTQGLVREALLAKILRRRGSYIVPTNEQTATHRPRPDMPLPLQAFTFYYLFDIDGSIMQQGAIGTQQKSDMGLLFRGFHKTVDMVPPGARGGPGGKGEVGAAVTER